jgi:hypothetical protein
MRKRENKMFLFLTGNLQHLRKYDNDKNFFFNVRCLLSIKLKYIMICTTSFVYTTPTTATLCADLKQSANIPPFKPEFPLRNIHLCTFSSFKKHSKNLFVFVFVSLNFFLILNAINILFQLKNKICC